MRTEKEMIDLIITEALGDSRIRAAYLEGSRTDPNIPADIFQDYDIVYIVTETESFQKDRCWIDRFGERLYMQYPEESVYYPSSPKQCYGWLIQFADGNRLDLHVCTWAYAKSMMGQYIVLVDKDDLFTQKQMQSDEQYWVERPDNEQFSCTCNEFWWCLNNVAKALWRKEIPYVMDMLDFNIRPMLRRLLEWKIGMEHDFTVSVGKSAKYMYKYLPEEAYEQYLLTYSAANVPAMWKAVFIMCDLFDETANEISSRLTYDYDQVEAYNSRYYLEHVSVLPSDAKEIF